MEVKILNMKMYSTQISFPGKDFKVQLGKLVGDVLLATGFLSYCGPYNQEFRANLLKCWMGILKTKQIPFTNNLNIINMLVESSTVSEWTLQVSRHKSTNI